MVMFLTIMLMSLAVLAVTCVAFAAATPREDARPEPRLERSPELEAPRFFAPEIELPVTRPQVPLEVLLSQLDRHVRLEQAAAQSFLALPSPNSLHSRTESPLVN
jgi:hypothetical protein